MAASFDLNQVRAAVASRLLGDAELIDQLAANAPWNDPTSPPSKHHSIVPMKEIDKVKPRYIGVMAGPLSRQDVPWRSFTYLRVYDLATSDYLAIDRIASRVAELLDDEVLYMDSTVNVQTEFEFMTPESYDDAMHQIYRELQFGLVIL